MLSNMAGLKMRANMPVRKVLGYPVSACRHNEVDYRGIIVIDARVVGVDS